MHAQVGDAGLDGRVVWRVLGVGEAGRSQGGKGPVEQALEEGGAGHDVGRYGWRQGDDVVYMISNGFCCPGTLLPLSCLLDAITVGGVWTRSSTIPSHRSSSGSHGSRRGDDGMPFRFGSSWLGTSRLPLWSLRQSWMAHEHQTYQGAHAYKRRTSAQPSINNCTKRSRPSRLLGGKAGPKRVSAKRETGNQHRISSLSSPPSSHSSCRHDRLTGDSPSCISVWTAGGGEDEAV